MREEAIPPPAGRLDDEPMRGNSAPPGRRKLDQVKGLGILQTVEEIAPLAPSNDNISVAQGHQMLRNVSLTQAQGGFQMAHAGFTISDHQQDAQALRLP